MSFTTARAFILASLLLLARIPHVFSTGRVDCLPLYPLPLLEDCGKVVDSMDKTWRHEWLNVPLIYSIDVEKDNDTHRVLPRRYFLTPYGPKKTQPNCEFKLDVVDPNVSRGDTFRLRDLTIGCGRILEWCFPKVENGRAYPGIEETVYAVAKPIRIPLLPNGAEATEGQAEEEGGGWTLVDEPVPPEQAAIAPVVMPPPDFVERSWQG